jgi:ketosteroid isomerase-like protein
VLVATESLGDPVQTNADLALFQRGDDPALLAVVRSQDGVIAEVVVTRAPQIAAAWMTALSMRPHAEVIDAFPGAFVVSTDTGFDAVRSDDGKTEHFSDRDAAVTRAEELAGLKPWMDMARNFVQAINSRDWDAFLSMYAHDYLLVDNRLMGWGELQGPEQMVEVLKGTIELAPDAALSLLELLDFDLDVGLGVARQTYTGQWDGGAYEIAWDSVMLVEDGRLIRGEVFGLDQVEAMRARVAELRASD